MFRNKSSNTTKSRERVIVGEEIIDLAKLRSEARSAGTRFWVLLVLVSLVSSMVVPYLSMASIAASNTTVFSGDVIPGYSMGGMPVAAYGVDINSWGQSGKQGSGSPTIVKSQYGYWTAKRADDASKNLVASQRADQNKEGTDLYQYKFEDEVMTNEEKAKGWIGITRSNGEGTGLSGFSDGGNGVAEDNRRYYDEAVSPYRTQADWRFWDSQSVGGTSPTMTATVYPDFVIFGWDDKEKTARPLMNPDDVQNSANSKNVTSVLANTAAVPHYVPLSTLFEEFGLGDSVMAKDGQGMNNMDALFEAIMEDAKHSEDGKKSDKLNKIVENAGNDPKYDLLLGTHYDNLNGENKATEPGSDAWNPYPYSMVFKMQSGSSTVVSSIYSNAEAYVYFSPQSAYNLYMSLRSEYDAIVNSSAMQVAEAQPQAAFQLGYYLAGMSILEAYLTEALPQDMTRGYVGPAEGNPLAASDAPLADTKKLNTRSSEKGTVANLFSTALDTVNSMVNKDGVKNDSAVGFRAVPYSQLMYDFADSAIAKSKATGEGTWLGATSAIMNTLSTYGYGAQDSGQNVNTASASAGQGPMRGMTRRQTMARVTSVGPYTKSADSLKASIDSDKDDPMIDPDVNNVANTGFYVPPYYPIQQHEMSPDTEMTYRFQVLSLIPYDTFAWELSQHGFNRKVTLSYDNNAVLRLDATKNYYNKVASLARQLDDLSSGSSESLSGFNKGKSVTLNPQTNSTTMVGEKGTMAYGADRDTTERIDNALMSFNSNLMNADNVHDLVDIVRAVPGVKYETFVRYYNPIKSSGGVGDIFLTRVTPAQTAYMPSVLTAGYESAGGTTNNESIASTAKADFDYFSIPSFAPCFAAKTSSDTFYGSLNYELRPFYTSGFLSTLSAATNVPALESFEEMKDQTEDEQEVKSAIAGMKTKILTIYVLAKRLAFATAYGKLSEAKGKEGNVTAGGLYYANEKQSTIESATNGIDTGAARQTLKPTDANKYLVPKNDNGSKGMTKLKKDEDLPSSAEVHGGGDNKLTDNVATLSSGDRYGESATGNQVIYNDDVYTTVRDSNGTITDVPGASQETKAAIQSAQQVRRDDIRREEASRAATATSGDDSSDGVGPGTDWGVSDYPSGGSGGGSAGGSGGAATDGTAGSSSGMSYDRMLIAWRHDDGRDGAEMPSARPDSGGNDYSVSGSRNHSFVAGAAMRGLLGMLTDLLGDALAPSVAFAAPSSDANSVYEKDKLESKGFTKDAGEEAKGKMSSQDGITFHIPSDLDIPTSGDFEYAMQKFGQKHILSDGTLSKKVVWCKTANGLTFVTDVKTVFSALYNDAYTHFLAPEQGDSYYWDAPKEIAKYGVQVDEGFSAKAGESKDYNTTAIKYSDATNAEKAKKDLDGYCEKAFADMDVMLSSLRMLNDNLPKQMQNVMAWADTQLASDSELSYQTDPSDNVLRINIGVQEDEGTVTQGTLHNIYEAQRMGFTLYDNSGDYAIGRPEIPESGVSSSDRQSRIVRGVAGTTSTASGHLAGYTISATVGRIERLVPSSASSLSIPYAGICTGDLNSGTDRYAQLQAHTIDRQAINAGLSGDLRSRGTSAVQVSVSDSQASLDTQEFVQVQGTLVSEFGADVLPNAIDIMEDSMARTMPSNGSATKEIKDANAGTRGLDLSGIAGRATPTQTLARASTFGSATMNRPSAGSVVYNASAKKMVYQSGGVTTAAAGDISRDRQWAESLVDGTFSDTYAVIQSVALILVLVFLMVIAFQNFIGYTSGRENDYIEAQTKLKTVLPRALIAVAMIGLPPIGGGVGFQGGCFLLLQIVNATLDSVLGVFTDGSDMFNTLMTSIGDTMVSSWWLHDIVFNLFSIVIELLAGVIFLLGSIFVVILCMATDVVLFLFWMIGPIAWAFYVWPYDSSQASEMTGKRGMKSMMGRVTGYMGLKGFTSGNVGRDAPTGWVMGYVSSLSTIAIWNLMFWGFSIVLTMMKSGASISDAASSLAGAAVNPTDSLYSPGSASDVLNGGSATMLPNNPIGHLLLALLFILVVYIMFRVFKNSMTGAMRFMYGAVGGAVNLAKTVALGHVAAAAKGANFAAKASQLSKAKDLASSPGGKVLDKALNLGAKGLDGGLHGLEAVDNVLNSPAASDVGNRMNKLIDNWSKDVQDRDASSGAFEGLVYAVPVTDEEGEVIGHQVAFTPAIDGAIDLGHKTAMGYHEMRLQHQKNKTKNQLTRLANKDNDWQCLRRSDKFKARMEGFSGATGDADKDVAALSESVRGRLSEAGTMGDAELRTLKSDASLLGIGDRQFDAMARGDMSAEKLDRQLEKATKQTREILSRAHAVESEAGGRAKAERRHEMLEERRSSIEARAMSVDRQFGKEVQLHNQELRAAGALTETQQRQRVAATAGKGMLQQAGSAARMVSGTKVVEEISKGGKLGPDTHISPYIKADVPGGPGGAQALTDSAWDHAEQNLERQQTREEIRGLKEVSRATVGANKAADTSDASLGELAASKHSDSIAALDRLREHQSDAEGNRS